MENWARVKWTEAGQIAELLDGQLDPGAQAGATPKAFFDTLKAQGRLHDAVLFLGQALPRYETVAWAVRAVRDLRQGRPGKPADANALNAALLWVDDPGNEQLRQAAYAAAELASQDSAERMAALSVYFSGGSIAPPDCPPVPAPRQLAGRLAAGAVALAAIDCEDQTRAYGRALTLGERFAVVGPAADDV
jgi:hypothetical protein